MAGFWVKVDIALDLPVLKYWRKLYADVSTSISGAFYTSVFPTCLLFINNIARLFM